MSDVTHSYTHTQSNVPFVHPNDGRIARLLASTDEVSDVDFKLLQSMLLQRGAVAGFVGGKAVLHSPVDKTYLGMSAMTGEQIICIHLVRILQEVCGKDPTSWNSKSMVTETIWSSKRYAPFVNR